MLPTGVIRFVASNFEKAIIKNTKRGSIFKTVVMIPIKPASLTPLIFMYVNPQTINVEIKNDKRPFD